MSNDHSSSRRKFLEQIGNAALLLSAGSLSTHSAEAAAERRVLHYRRKFAPSDKVRIACIGLGIMGNHDVATALQVPDVSLAAVCDLYTGRLERARELYGKDLFTTRDYREILERQDIDAVIVATSDNWHARISTAALDKGKAVYCEKPMVHRIEEGLPLIAAQERSKKTFQVGSQRVSSVAYAKARELVRAGEIGKLNCIEASFDRQSATGAWEYTMPADQSEKTVDWDRYIAGMPKEPYDPKKFFWWRNYRAMGTGVAGDLFVHLLSGIHVITGSKGPERIFSSGQLAYWRDGRDVPDVMTGIMHYPDSAEHPAFDVMLRVNFVSGQGETSTVKFIGSEGVMDMGYNGFTIHHRKMPLAPGIGGWDALETYPQAMQDMLIKQYNERYSADDKKATITAPTEYRNPDNFNEDLEHHLNFYESIRTGKPVVEDAVFGFRAAAPCLAANESYFQKKIIQWDPANMVLKG
ncbi:MAG: Gfo/Idh/MocA family oxidoreductase [Bacteroidota bacterium]|nr:Gfo/Idh/MocA family oxidoreductase [Bacteroidota bacterium]MDP4244315.1 Gfo/Idh/MocA family oxidoreductase [Bacteroidota bacterium]MDP4257560.1 Gfo/Idh/MocA family oxidoreductase [Bacteroidota bacterium]